MLNSLHKQHKYHYFNLIKTFKILLFPLICMTLMSCGSTKKASTEQFLKKSGVSALNDTHFAGFYLYNPDTKKTIIEYNSDKQFTPASNTKIVTLYSALHLLGDTIPAYSYAMVKDTLVLAGTGDPSLLHPYFNDSTALNFAASYPNVKLYLDNFHDTPYAPGWAWEDYQWYFSPERSGLPMYGNSIELYYTDKLYLNADYFRDNVMLESDNFLAEQLMILASSTLSDSLSFKKTRNHILKNKLPNLPQVPRWVDGSGLSRYNLFSPKSLGYILNEKSICLC